MSLAAVGDLTREDVINLLNRMNSTSAKVQLGTILDEILQETTSASNVGAGDAEVFKAEVGNDLRFRTLVAGANITVTENADTIEIAAAGGAGEANTASNQGGGEGLFIQKTGVDLEFKTIVAGSGITLTPAATTLTIAASGGAGANTALSNLAAVAVNTDILPDTDGNGGTPRDLGSATLRWREVWAQIMGSGAASDMYIFAANAIDTGAQLTLFSAGNANLKNGAGTSSVDVNATLAITAATAMTLSAPIITAFDAEIVIDDNYAHVFNGASIAVLGGKEGGSGSGVVFGSLDKVTEGTSLAMFSSGSVTDVGSANATGEVQIRTGDNAGTGPTGDIFVTVGSADGGGTRGSVFLSGLRVQVDSPLTMAKSERHVTREDSTATITVSATNDWFIAASGTDAGAVTVNLPAGVAGQEFIIKDTDGNAGTNNITIDADGAETIDEALTYVINTNFGSAHLVFVSGIGWQVVN